MTINLPAPSAASPSGQSVIWEGEGWWIKVLPNGENSALMLSQSTPAPADLAATREYALALVAATEHIAANS